MTENLVKFGRADDWLRWLVGGLVAGLVAYASVGSRLATLETTVEMGAKQAAEDRRIMRQTVDDLRREVTQLTIELRQEEQLRKDSADERRSNQSRPR